MPLRVGPSLCCWCVGGNVLADDEALSQWHSGSFVVRRKSQEHKDESYLSCWRMKPHVDGIVAVPLNRRSCSRLSHFSDAKMEQEDRTSRVNLIGLWNDHCLQAILPCRCLHETVNLHSRNLVFNVRAPAVAIFHLILFLIESRGPIESFSLLAYELRCVEVVGSCHIAMRTSR